MQAQALNERRHVTGVLVYGDGQFMQVLEGEEKIVRDLYARIAQDKRHHNIFKLADKAIATRTFPDWSMAFHAVSPAEFARVAAVRGYRAPGELRPYLPAEGVDSLLLGRLQELLDATGGS